nr:hypothetical protein [Candidatus Liberibacter asiaticus]
SVVNSIKIFFKKIKMIKAIDQEQQSFTPKLFHFKGMFENNGGRHTKSLSIENASNYVYQEDDDDEEDEEEEEEEEAAAAHKNLQGGKSLNELERKQISNAFNCNDRVKEEIAALKEAKERLAIGKLTISF